MAKTNENGYFCDYPCGLRNSKCQHFFRAGCATAGMPLQANTEYPEAIRVHVDKYGRETREE